jgi:stress response protein SCP2
VIQLSSGQELAMTTTDGQPLTEVQVGVGWDKERLAGILGTGKPDVDLDVSAVQFAGKQFFDLAFYNNLQTRDGSLVHLGDNTTGDAEGDDESLTVDLSRVYAKVDTIVFLVSSYQGHTLEWVRNAYCRVVGGEDTELFRFTMSGGVPRTGLVLAKLVRVGEQWTFHAIGRGIAVKVPTESLDALQPFL